MDNPQNTPTNPAPEVQPVPPVAHKSTGLLIGTLVALVVLLAGGAFVYDRLMQEGDSVVADLGGDANENSGLPPTSNSDAVADIGADIESTDLAELETQIDADMRAAESSL